MGLKACLLLSLACAVAHAQAPPDPMAEARQLHAEGAAAYRLGHYEEAIDRFEASYRLARLAALLFDVGQAHRKLWEQHGDAEHLRRAIDLYRTFLRDAPPEAARRNDAAVLLPQLEEALAALERKRRAEVATGRDGLAMADGLTAEGALDDADRAIARVLDATGNSRELVGGAWVRRGLVESKRGARDRAVAALVRALSLGAAPLPALEGTEALAEAQRLLAGATLAIVAGERAPAAAGQPLRLRFRVVGDPAGLVERVSAVCRRDDGPWNETSTAKSATELVVDASPAAGSRFECYLVALGAAASQLAQSGSPAEPIRISVAAAPSPPRTVEHARPWHRRWWVWTLVGGVAAASLAVGLGVAYGTPSGPPTLHVPLH